MRTLRLARDVWFSLQLIGWGLGHLAWHIGPELCVVILGVAIVAVSI